MADKIWIAWESRKVLTNRGEHFDEINRIYSKIVKDDKQLETYLYNRFNSMADMFKILLNQEENINNIYTDFDNWCYNRAKERVREAFEEIELK